MSIISVNPISLCNPLHVGCMLPGNYSPCSFCSYAVNYDETYDVIYEIIMRKSGISMEPFWDLKISKHVKNLTHVSSKYLPYKLGAMF